MIMTQIYGTLGPNSSDQATIEAMLRAGMTGARLNLSHEGLEGRTEQLKNFWAAAQAVGVKPELLIDTQGAELRMGDLPKPLDLPEGSEAVLGADGIPVPKEFLGVTAPGDEVLLDDGKISLEIVSADGTQAKGIVRRGGQLGSRKTIKLTGKSVPLPVSTEQDLVNIKNAPACGVTGIMQSFVQRGEDLVELKQSLKALGAEHLKIFAKIETMEGVANLESILPLTDVVVIARGDLGSDLPLWQLPAVQKNISAACRAAGKPFIVVTQMLTSMESNPVPTRAEVSDIFNAVADGASGVMVTSETAMGDYPVEVITYMTKTSAEAEQWIAAQC